MLAGFMSQRQIILTFSSIFTTSNNNDNTIIHNRDSKFRIIQLYQETWAKIHPSLYLHDGENLGKYNGGFSEVVVQDPHFRFVSRVLDQCGQNSQEQGLGLCVVHNLRVKQHVVLVVRHAGSLPLLALLITAAMKTFINTRTVYIESLCLDP